MLEIPQRIWKKAEGYTKPQGKPFRTNHENVLCWKALSKADKKPVVIKLFEWDIVEHCADELRAAEILKKINHKHLVRVLDVVEDEEIGIYYVMEHWGDDLRNTIKVKPDPKIAIEIIKQVLEGLAELHRHKLSHRDIKPENIFINPAYAEASAGRRWWVKIGDYGLVKSQRFITQLTTIAGTRDYMAPEVLAGESYDHRCDIYSTGVVLRELLTGEQPPFSGEASDEVIQKAMAKEPKDRFQTAEEFIDALIHHKDIPFLRYGTPINWVSRYAQRSGAKDTKKEISVLSVSSVVKNPIFQELKIQRYPPKPEMRGQDNPGVLVKTLQAKLDELINAHDANASLPVAEEWVKAVEQRFTRQNSRTADAYDRLAGIYLLLDNYQKSEETYRISLEIDRVLYGANSRQWVNDYYNLGRLFIYAGNYAKAKECFIFARKIAIKNTSDYAIIANNAAVVHYCLKEYKDGLALLKEALVINEKQNRFSEPVAINLYNMALTYEAMGNKGTAEPLYKQAKETLAKLPPDKLAISDKDKEQIIGGN
jgi:tetratricopeptide (TPR) repeat protein